MRNSRTIGLFAIVVTVVLLMGIAVCASASEEGRKLGAEHPALSPNGQKIVFSSDIDGNRELWIVDAAGGTPVRLLMLPDSDEKEPDWFPDGSRIVFASTRNGTNHQVWVVSTDGTEALQLTTDSAEHSQPRVSPSGDSILYLSNATGKKELWTMKPDGSSQKPLALITTGVSDPTWAPSGLQIVYSGCRPARECNLFRINADGSEGFQITRGDFQDWVADWKAPGIIFASNRNGRQGLWLVQADGTGLQEVTNPDAVGDLDPRWSSTGTSFVFTRSAGGPSDTADVWLSSAAPGSIPQRITRLTSGAFKCALGQGYWKNHPGAWPAERLTLGSRSYTKTVLANLLKTSPKGDASIILVHQLIATKLNVANGSNPTTVGETISHADGLLSGFNGTLPYAVKASTTTGAAMTSDATLLGSYNESGVTQECRP